MPGLLYAPTFSELRPSGAEGLSNAQVLGELAKVLPTRGATPAPAADISEALAKANGAGAVSLFGGGSDVEAEPAAEDFEALVLRANVVLEGVVTSWAEAAARLHKIFMLAARRTETAAALHTGTAAKAWRKDTEASESALRALVPKAGSGALAQGYAAAALRRRSRWQTSTSSPRGSTLPTKLRTRWPSGSARRQA